MALDPAPLNLLASLLVVYAGSLLFAQERKFPAWWFSTYALASLLLGLLVLFLSGTPFEANVYYFGLAVALGLTTAALVGKEAPIRPDVHLVSAGAGLAYGIFFAILAANYRWWIAPLAILTLIVAGLTFNYLVPGVKEFWKNRRAARPAAHEPQAQPKPPTPSPVPAPADGTLEAEIRPKGDDTIAFACPNCNHPGEAPAILRGKRVRCPRCASLIRLGVRAPTTGG